MHEWQPSPEELHVDWLRANVWSRHLEPVACDARIAFHDGTQEAVKVITPAPRFIAALMAGGFIRAVRVVREENGRPVLEGDADAMPIIVDGHLIDVGKPMGPLTYDEAVAFVAWKDMPHGVNRYSIMTTDDLPRIDGCIDRARKFRAAWQLEEAA